MTKRSRPRIPEPQKRKTLGSFRTPFRRILTFSELLEKCLSDGFSTKPDSGRSPLVLAVFLARLVLTRNTEGILEVLLADRYHLFLRNHPFRSVEAATSPYSDFSCISRDLSGSAFLLVPSFWDHLETAQCRIHWGFLRKPEKSKNLTFQFYKES